MDTIKKGDKFLIIKDFHTDVLTCWGKPYTGSEKCIIPKGTVVIAPNNQQAGTQGFIVVPKMYKELESLFVSELTRQDKDYSNYYFVFMNKDYSKYFIRYQK